MRGFVGWMAVVVAVAGLSGCATTGVVRGQVLATPFEGGEVEPQAHAVVWLRPIEPAADRASRAPEEVTFLSGVSTTDDEGRFAIDFVGSRDTFEKYALLRGWTYELEVRFPGYEDYIGTLVFERGELELRIELADLSAEERMELPYGTVDPDVPTLFDAPVHQPRVVPRVW
jgi:hypothetical protein